MMKRGVLLMVWVMLVFAYMGAWAGQDGRKERKITFNSAYNYEIQVLTVGMNGTKVYKVWGYGKKVDDAIINAKKSAVAAAIFKDIPGSSGVEGSPAICQEGNAAERHADYFDSFFSAGGKYLNYVNLTNDGIPAGKDRIKMKKGYKVGIVVQVLYDNLRKDLEDAGIVKPMNYGF